MLSVHKAVDNPDIVVVKGLEEKKGAKVGIGDDKMEEGADEKVDNPDNSNFVEVVKNEGEKMYQCNICQEEFKLPGTVKRHITTKHGTKRPVVAPRKVPTSSMKQKRKKESFEEENHTKKAKSEQGFELNASMLKEFDATFEFTSSTQNENLENVEDILNEYERVYEKLEDNAKDVTVTEKKANVGTDIENVNAKLIETKQELEYEKNKVVELNEKLEEKIELEAIAQGKN